MEAVQQQDAPASPPDLSTHDERWLLVRRIVRSEVFSRSDQLSRLLLYVCRAHVTGRDDEINEQRIGVDVFRRKPSFDSGSDSIVRSHATRLRQRLHLYFETVGSQEVLRVEIPRGGYIPRFYTEGPHSVSSNAGAVREDGLPIENKPDVAETFWAQQGPQKSWLWKALMLLAAASIASASFYLGHSFSDKSKMLRQTEVERQFWSTVFGNNLRTLVVTGDSGLVLYETYARHDVSLSDYIAGNYHLPAESSVLQSNSLERDLPARRYTSVADLNLAIKLSRLPEWSDEHAEAVFARDLRASDAARSNLVLIGSRQANPWVSLIDSSMNFVLTPDGNGTYYFVNRHPMPGEQASYQPSQSGSGTSDSAVYALVCFRPAESGNGNVLLLSGLWQSGTEAAGKYVMTDKHFVDFLKRIVRRDGSFPEFELLVQVRSVAGNAFTSSIVAERVH